MFTYNKKLQYTVRVDRPDPAFARKLQELIGGKYGEMSVMLQYLFQGWGMRGDATDPQVQRIKDMLMDTACEEIAHVEMVSTCVSMLLNGAEPQPSSAVGREGGMATAQFAGMDPQHMIVSGLGAQPVDSVGNPWNGAYITASGNVVSDMYANATAEMNGRLQACRMFQLTDDPGVRDMLHFMIARDHMHQLQWLAVIEDLGGMQAALPVPTTFPLSEELGQYAYAFMSYAQDMNSTAGAGRWAQGPAPDGKGTFNYIAEPFATGEVPHLPLAPSALFGAPPKGDVTVARGTRGTVKGTAAKGTTAEDESPSIIKRVGNMLNGE